MATMMRHNSAGKIQAVKEAKNKDIIKTHKNKYMQQHLAEVEARKKNAPKTTMGATPQLQQIADHVYSIEEIKRFRMSEGIDNNPLADKNGAVRSKLAYKFIMDNKNLTAKYLLPGQVCVFSYNDPKYKEELPYFDKTPMTLFFGIFRNKEGNIREIGLNLHYFPPYTRKKVLSTVYTMFKSYFEKCFNAPTHKPNQFMDYATLKRILSKDSKIAFAVKEYIPMRRGLTYVIPTKLLPTAFYTEGHFSKATYKEIFNYWRQFSR